MTSERRGFLNMAQFNVKLLRRLVVITSLLLPCEGFYSYQGVRYSYGCTGWLYMGTTVKWKYGEHLLAPFIGLSYPCESDACDQKGGLCKPAVCGAPCEYFCDKENIFFSLLVLDDGVEVPKADAECTSHVCLDSHDGTANIVCMNYKLKPNIQKKYALHLTVNVTQQDDDKPAKNKDADMYIVAGDVNVSQCTGSWLEERDQIKAGIGGHFIIQLMDGFGNQVSATSGREGGDLDVDFRPSITAGDTSSISDINCKRNEDTGTYSVTFMTSKTGNFSLTISAFLSPTEYYNIQGSPFPFKVVSGGIDIPSCTGSWVVPGPVNPGESVILRVEQKDKAKEVWLAEDYVFKAVVARALGSTRNFSAAVINSSGTVGSPGSQDFVVNMQSAGDFILQILSEAGDEQIEGSPFPFTVKTGEMVLDSTEGSWPGGVNTFPAGAEAVLRVLVVDKDGNYIDPLPEGKIKGTIEEPATDNRTLPDTPVTSRSELGRTGYQLLAFTPQLIGQFEIRVTGSDGTAIPGSPFSFTVIVGLPSASKCKGSWLSGINKFVVGETATFVITLMDEYGNNVTTGARGGSRLAGFSWNISIINQDDPSAPPDYSVSLGAPTDAGIQLLTFSPTATGTFALRVNASNDIQGSPFVFTVRAGYPVMSSCTASWLDATTDPPHYTAGSHPKMEVTQKDAQKNIYPDLFLFTLKVVAAPATMAQPISPLNLSSPVSGLKTEEGLNMSQGKVIVTFEAVAAGQFQLHIGDGESGILGSPFTFIVLPGPLAIDGTTGGWENNKVEFNLKDKVQFLITQRDAYGNPVSQDKSTAAAVTAYFSGKVFQAGESRREVQLSDLTIEPIGDLVWTQEKLQFTVTQAGNFELEVYVSAGKFYVAEYWYYFQKDEVIQIVGSPFNFFVGAGEIYVPVCNASGPGLTGGAVGDTLKFTIYTYTKELVASPAPASRFKLEFNPEVAANPVLKEGSGNAINVGYRITVPSGPSGYAMTVKAATTSEEIKGSPFRVNITAGPLVIQNCTGHFKGGTPVVSLGRTAIFIIYQQDIYGNKIYTDSSGVHNYTVEVLKEDQSPVTLDIKLTPSVSDEDQVLVTFNMTKVGEYILEVGDSSGSIKGSPFAFSVVQGAVVTADQCKAQFVPDEDIQVGMYINIIITSYDAAGQPKYSETALEFEVTSVPAMIGTPNPLAPKDLGNGTYVATMKITSTGLVSFLIDLYGEAIAGNPFEFEVEAGTTLPRAEYDDVWTWMNYALTFNVLKNDYVPSGSPIFVEIDSPENGDMTIGQDGTMIYTPDNDYTGSEYLSYEMKDEAGEVAFGEVSITVCPPGQPYISAFPRMLSALEDEPLPANGGIANVEVASLEPDTVLSAELFALRGRIYPAAELFGPWSNVSVIIPNNVPAENATENATMEEPPGKVGFQLKLSDQITQSNDDSNALRFSARLEHMNAALKALQYMGLENYNGNDTVYFTVLNPAGVGSTKSMSVNVRAVNDPPFVVGPSVFTINLSSSEAFVLNFSEVGVPITGLAVGDPDADDRTGSATYDLAGILQVDSGQFEMTIPPSGYTSASYRVPGETNWSSIPEHQIVVRAQGIRFKASIFDWNTALQGLTFKGDNASTQRVELSLVVDDLGKFGCVADCTDKDPYSYVIQHQTAIMIYEKGYKPPYRMKAFVKFMLYAMGGIAGLLGVFYLAAKGGRRCTWPWRRGSTTLVFEEVEETFKMIRVYNPLWIPTYQKAETTTGLEPTGTGFEVQQDWKMESMVEPGTGPPLGNESMPLDTFGQGGDDSFQVVQPADGGVRARKFSVKWAADVGVRLSASSGGPQDDSSMFTAGDGQLLQPPGPLPLGAAFGEGSSMLTSGHGHPLEHPGPLPFGAFEDASFGHDLGGAGASFAAPVPPPPDASFGSGEKPFTGFGDEGYEEVTTPLLVQSGGPPPPDGPFPLSLNDLQVPPPPMDSTFNVSVASPPPPPRSF